MECMQLFTLWHSCGNDRWNSMHLTHRYSNRRVGRIYLPFLHYQHHTEKNDDEEQGAGDDPSYLDCVVGLFLRFDGIRLPGGCSCNRQGFR